MSERYIIGNTLRIGLLVAIILIVSGFIVFLVTNPNANLYEFNTKNISLTDFSNPLTITLYGIIVLISLPVIIVLEQVVIYSLERDKLYIIISLTVLAIMLFAIIILPKLI